jgi:hypothetical protein
MGCRRTGPVLRHIFGTLFLLLAIAISPFSTEVMTKRLGQSLLHVNIAGLRTGSAVVSEGDRISPTAPTDHCRLVEHLYGGVLESLVDYSGDLLSEVVGGA